MCSDQNMDESIRARRETCNGLRRFPALRSGSLICKVGFRLNRSEIGFSYVGRSDYFVERSDYFVERSDLERSDHGTK